MALPPAKSFLFLHSHENVISMGTVIVRHLCSPAPSLNSTLNSTSLARPHGGKWVSGALLALLIEPFSAPVFHRISSSSSKQPWKTAPPCSTVPVRIWNPQRHVTCPHPRKKLVATPLPADQVLMSHPSLKQASISPENRKWGKRMSAPDFDPLSSRKPQDQGRQLSDAVTKLEQNTTFEKNNFNLCPRSLKIGYQVLCHADQSTAGTRYSKM